MLKDGEFDTFTAMPKGNRIYFASDFHLGEPDLATTRKREAAVVRWLDTIKADAAELYLVGDIFDFWFEYQHAVPRGYVRFIGKLAELADMGIRITFFKGNHDMWMFGYFKEELGVEIISDELIIERGGKRFFIHHGDGLGPGDRKYKLLKKIFRSRLCQWLFARLHPNLGIGIAMAWSRDSRSVNRRKQQFAGKRHEWLAHFSAERLKEEHFDYFIFGHRHLPLDLDLSPGAPEGNAGRKSRYINLGEWINFQSYAVFDGQEMHLEYFEPPEGVDITAAIMAKTAFP